MTDERSQVLVSVSLFCVIDILIIGYSGYYSNYPYTRCPTVIRHQLASDFVV